jgi:hypothetical protein
MIFAIVSERPSSNLQTPLVVSSESFASGATIFLEMFEDFVPDERQ